jgi:hypothetical protein
MATSGAKVVSPHHRDPADVDRADDRFAGTAPTSVETPLRCRRGALRVDRADIGLRAKYGPYDIDTGVTLS